MTAAFDPFEHPVAVSDCPGFDEASPPEPRTVCRDTRAPRLRNPAPGDELVAEKFFREDIWERDGGVCQICLTEIPQDRTGRRGPLAYVTDHMDPFGDHVMSNLRAAHDFCNGSKGARLGDPEVDVARAALAVRLRTGRPPKRSSIDGGLRLDDDQPLTWWRKVARRWRPLSPAELDEVGEAYLAYVRHWADRLPEEVAHYLVTWFAGVEPCMVPLPREEGVPGGVGAR